MNTDLKCGIRDDNFGEGRSQALPGDLPHRRPHPLCDQRRNLEPVSKSSVQLEDMQASKTGQMNDGG